MPQEFAVMLDDKKLADMRRREMQHMINRFYHQQIIVSNSKIFFPGLSSTSTTLPSWRR